jgi:hypothetical protein
MASGTTSKPIYEAAHPNHYLLCITQRALLLIAGVAFYFIITSELNKSMDESLLNTKNHLENYLKTKQDTSNYAAPDGDSFMRFVPGLAQSEYKF